MAFQPLGGICWGLSAVRPPSPVAAGLVVCSGGGWPPAAAPGPCRAADPPLRVAWPSLALPPPAVLPPTSTAVASIPTRSVDLIILRVSPGRFRPVFAALPMGPPPCPWDRLRPPSAFPGDTRVRHHSGMEVPQPERATPFDSRRTAAFTAPSPPAMLLDIHRRPPPMRWP